VNKPHLYDELDISANTDGVKWYRADDPAIVRALAIDAVVGEWVVTGNSTVRSVCDTIQCAAEARIAKLTPCDLCGQLHTTEQGHPYTPQPTEGER
jgi:hypothetical protein